MELKINGQCSTKEIIEAFSASFEGTKIEFFRHSHAQEEGSPKKDMVNEVVLLNELNSNIPTKTLIINDQMTVNEVEELFEKELGLHVQVFRKMNTTWIETTTTDAYSLEKQVKLSKASRGIYN